MLHWDVSSSYNQYTLLTLLAIQPYASNFSLIIIWCFRIATSWRKEDERSRFWFWVFPHKIGDKDRLLQIAASAVLEVKWGCEWTDGILLRKPPHRTPTEKKAQQICMCGLRGSVQGTLQWMSWENLWMGFAATKLHYWLENAKCFLMQQLLPPPPPHTPC